VPDLFNVNGEVKKVFTHRQMCPIPNAIDEVNRLNNRSAVVHEHKWTYSTLQLPGSGYAKISRCIYRMCNIRVMVMLEPIETRTWSDSETTGTTIAERAREKHGRN